MSESANERTGVTRHLEIEDPRSLEIVFGPRQSNVRFLQRALNVRVQARGRRLSVRAASEAEAQFAHELLSQLLKLAQSGYDILPGDVERSIRVMQSSDMRLSDIFLDTILKTDRGRGIAPKSPAQKSYIEAIRNNDIVFGVGPAGTGKTYLAMAMALDAFLGKRVKRIILTRPAVEAGEKLGFLPGDLAEKVNPYLRPLKDALHDMIDPDRAAMLMETGRIEVAPLAFMRGRTLNDSFVILDEAQNATREQMKMFLTRLGFDTKTVVTGDTSQVDLPDNQRSGLSHATELLDGISGIAISRFTEFDVVRHPLVMSIIRAYDRAERDGGGD